MQAGTAVAMMLVADL